MACAHTAARYALPYDFFSPPHLRKMQPKTKPLMATCVRALSVYGWREPKSTAETAVVTRTNFGDSEMNDTTNTSGTNRKINSSISGAMTIVDSIVIKLSYWKGYSPFFGSSGGGIRCQ